MRTPQNWIKSEHSTSSAVSRFSYLNSSGLPARLPLIAFIGRHGPDHQFPPPLTVPHQRIGRLATQGTRKGRWAWTKITSLIPETSLLPSPHSLYSFVGRRDIWVCLLAALATNRLHCLDIGHAVEILSGMIGLKLFAPFGTEWGLVWHLHNSMQSGRSTCSYNASVPTVPHCK